MLDARTWHDNWFVVEFDIWYEYFVLFVVWKDVDKVKSYSKQEYVRR